MSDERTKTPTEDSTLIELLECVDDGLRNGRLMTRANLAFEYLLKRLDLTRNDLPSYVADIAALRAEDEAYFAAFEEAHGHPFNEIKPRGECSGCDLDYEARDDLLRKGILNQTGE